MFSFLWNNKISKINVSTVQKQYCDGNMIIIEKKIGTLKNKFWKDVLQSLININKKSVVSETDLLKSPIFYNNNNIKIGGTYIFYSMWYNIGIKYINDLINENGKFYTETEFTAKTGIKTNLLQHSGLIKAIKIYLKDMNTEITHKEQCPFIPSHISSLLQHQKRSKAMYNILNKNGDTPTGQCSWNKIFNITKEEWKGIYMFPFHVTEYEGRAKSSVTNRLPWFYLRYILKCFTALEWCVRYPFISCKLLSN